MSISVDIRLPYVLPVMDHRVVREAATRAAEEKLAELRSDADRTLLEADGPCSVGGEHHWAPDVACGLEDRGAYACLNCHVRRS